MPPPRFYLYPDHAFDQSWLLGACLPRAWHNEEAAEVSLGRALWRHPRRVDDPALAALFVVPVWPFTSLAAGACRNTTHEERMKRAVVALARSPFLRRHGGHDHLLVCNSFRLIHAFGRFRHVLANATVAWFEDAGIAASALAAGTPRPKLHGMAFWRCTVVVPYVANRHCAAALARQQTAAAAGRQISIFFQGSFAAGGYVRRHLAALSALPRAHVVDVARGARGAGHGPDGGSAEAAARLARSSTVEGTAEGLSHSEFCVVPRGDTATSS